LPNLLNNISDQALRKDLAKIDYSFYLELVHRGRYRHAKHTEYICQKLRQVELGEIRKMMLLMPPRHSKSMTVTETLPSYFIGKDPDRRVIVVSYSQDLAQKFGRANKNKIAEFGQKIFGVRLSRSTSSQTIWEIEGHRGGMKSVGVGSGITGEGADLLIIDDPIKSRKEADSISYRENLWNEYRNSMLTRLQPDASIIVIVTRWHEDDLAGRLLENEGDEWSVVSLPCECEDDDDPIGRKKGDFLWPSYGFDKAWGEQRKKEIGSRAWTALYQQRPAPSGGAILKRHWWQYWVPTGKSKQFKPIAVFMPSNDEEVKGKVVEFKPVELPTNFDRIIQSWDMTFMGNEAGRSYVVGEVFGQLGANFYLLDIVREKLDFPGTLRAFESLCAKWPQTGPKWVEFAANGPAVMQALQNKISGIIGVKPEGNKEARGHAISHEVEAGNVFIPHPALYPWVEDFIEECATAPWGLSDDQFDAFTQAINCMTKHKRRAPARAASVKSKRRR